MTTNLTRARRFERSDRNTHAPCVHHNRGPSGRCVYCGASVGTPNYASSGARNRNHHAIVKGIVPESLVIRKSQEKRSFAHELRSAEPITKGKLKAKYEALDLAELLGF